MRRFAVAVAATLFAVPFVFAQDPVKVSPGNFKVEVDNPQVRVLRATLGPHEKVPMHQHEESVLVLLTDVHEKFTAPDGSVQEARRKKGETAHRMPVTHTEENLSDQPLEAVIIEFKPGAGPFHTPLSPEFDPVKIDSEYHTVDFENERVRVLRTVLMPGIQSPMHEHPSYVVVYLTALHTKMTYPNPDNVRVAGEVGFRVGPFKHSTVNVGTERAEEIQVELK